MKHQIRKDFMIGDKLLYKELHELYQFNTDEYLKSSNDPVACTKGCYYCCYLNVQVDQEEMDYIMDRYKKEEGPKEYMRVLVDSKERAEVMSKIPSIDDRAMVKRPCAFLKDSKCSIYEYRPLQCRSMNVTTLAQCLEGFNGNPKVQTEYHAKPKMLLGIIAIAITAIRNNLEPLQAIQYSFDNKEDWSSLEEAVLDFDKRLNE
jgi:Fe-S-cluster containining protein